MLSAATGWITTVSFCGNGVLTGSTLIGLHSFRGAVTFLGEAASTFRGLEAELDLDLDLDPLREPDDLYTFLDRELLLE